MSRVTFPAIHPVDIAECIIAVSKAHQQHFEQDKGACEIACLRAQLPLQFLSWQPGDIFVGRSQQPMAGFYPQIYTKRSGFGYFADQEKLTALIKDAKLENSTRKELTHWQTYWQQYDSVNFTRDLFPVHLQATLPDDDWIGKAGSAFPLYRMAGSQLDYEKLLKWGITGIKEAVKEKLKHHILETRQANFIENLLELPKVLDSLIENYERHIEDKLAEADETQTNNLLLIRESLVAVRSHPPANLHQAIQLMLLYNSLAGSQNYGRIDHYLADFLQKDVENGLLKLEEATGYICSLWRLMEARGTIYDGRAIIGGRGRENVTWSDRVASLCLQASKKEKSVLPQLTLRFHPELNDRIMQEALETIIATGIYPMLYADEVNIPSVIKAFNFTETEAVNYAPFGCGEYTLDHASFDTPNGVINLLQVLHEVLQEKDEWTDFEALFAAYRLKTEKYVEALARAQKLIYQAAAKISPFLLFSLLYDDCLERAKPVFEGGIRYLGGTLETYGNVNTANALLAIKQMVFDQKETSMKELKAALAANFTGYEWLRKKLIELPKYGNNHPEADQMMMAVHEHVCQATRGQAERVGLHHYLVVIINNDANTDLGKNTSASADGRLAGEGLNNGNSPVVGTDQSGITALLHSLSKLSTEIHAGAVQNLKIAPEWLTEHREKFLALVQTYFSMGGAQLMITVVQQEMLEDAMLHPEKYPNLLVRVGGFSARFIDLRPEVQREIVNRTAYSV